MSKPAPVVNGEDAIARSAFRKAAVRLVPFVALMFFINFLDRTAIGVAGPNGMNDDLAMTAAQFGLASGIFFLGYILLEVPSNIQLHKVGARRWLARIMVSWGIVSLLFTFVQNSGQLYGLRFLLGVAEAGFTPGAVLFLTLWFPKRYRVRALMGFYLAQPITLVLGPPIGGLIVEHLGGFLGLEGWRVLFLFVSLPAIIIGIVAWFYLTDSPSQARWLTAEEKSWFQRELRDDEEARQQGGRHGKLAEAFKNPKVFAIAFAYLGLNYGVYSLAFFLPTIVAGFEEQFDTDFSVVERGLIAAIPYTPAAIALAVWAMYSARKGFRQWHVALPLTVAGLSIPVALYMPTPTATVAVVVLTACGTVMTFSLFWSLPTTFLTGAGAAAGFALINSIANLGGFSAPYITGLLADLTGSYRPGLFVSGVALLMSAAIVMSLRLPQTATQVDEPDIPETPEELSEIQVTDHKETLR